MKKIFTLIFVVVCSIGLLQAQTIPSGGSIQEFIDAAADGAVLELESGGIYTTETLLIPKSITLKAADGATMRPVIYMEETNGINFGEAKSGAEIMFKGIEFASLDSRYLCRFATGDSLAYLEFTDVVAHGYDRSFIRASDPGIFIDSILIQDSYFYNFDEGGQTYRFFYFDKGDCPVKYFKASNSTFVGFNRTFLQINSPDTKKTVIVDQCNIHRRSDSREDDLFDIDGAEGTSFKLSNSIISSIKLAPIWDVKENVVDSIMNCFYSDIEFADNMIVNTWSYETAFTATDPMFSNAAAGALYLDPASPALTASTTGGAIGDSRWVVAPANASLLEITTNAGMMPAFTTDVLVYNLTVPYGTASVDVVAVPNFADATVAGTGTVAISSGSGTATLVVTGGDASELTYTLNITEALPSTDATLSELIPDVGTLDPVFDPAVLSYTLEAPIATDTVFFDFTVADGTATVVDTDTVDVQSGSGTATFEVTAQDGTTVLTYTVTITVLQLSTDATLSSLTLDVGTLNPSFDAAVEAYTAEVPEGTTSVTVDATATGVDIATLTGTGAVDVSSGSGAATIVVTAEDGTTTKTYTVDITVLVGIDNVEMDLAQMYYNHLSDQLIIKNSSNVETVEIYTITGKKIFTVENYLNESMEISTSNLINGLYLVRMKNSDKGVQSGKFVK